ncbi:hypothetical protein M758_3G118200 [Ceratodon purpureus]|uniref:Uncharacterized protein n=1 Tax=Ceratodon purpureus TaxID=3225 RepID=A0A8T0IK01_CERPU|nr:hypothetical protein KC19_3G116800 [Ceratodon purpureus]KAG0622713.1 hypothetical protein M758_3G118200 [Ceratodon purpureus]
MSVSCSSPFLTSQIPSPSPSPSNCPSPQAHISCTIFCNLLTSLVCMIPSSLGKVCMYACMNDVVIHTFFFSLFCPSGFSKLFCIFLCARHVRFCVAFGDLIFVATEFYSRILLKNSAGQLRSFIWRALYGEFYMESSTWRVLYGELYMESFIWRELCMEGASYNLR